MINKILVLTEFQNGCNKVVIELRVVQFWSEIILVISNRTRAARSSDFQITCMISTKLHSTQCNYHYKSEFFYLLGLPVETQFLDPCSNSLSAQSLNIIFPLISLVERLSLKISIEYQQSKLPPYKNANFSKSFYKPIYKKHSSNN